MRRKSSAMRIAIASGKGGAGKTTLTAALHCVWPRRHVVVDADVEAPNLHLFLHPTEQSRRDVTLPVPTAVSASCTACGQCREICHFGAIARFGHTITLFPDMCHGCGGCFAVCPEKALTRGQRLLGTLAYGALADGTPYLSGTTRIGEVMTPPVLRHLLAHLDALPTDTAKDVLVDSPPGVSCPAITVARRVDAVLLVVDPTPFGLADFRIACAAFQALHRPLAVVINRAGMPGNESGEAAVSAFCQAQDLPVIGTVPFTREAARLLAQGQVLPQVDNAWRECFCRIADSLAQMSAGGNHA